VGPVWRAQAKEYQTMTTQKTLKRRVRARAAKTGESYTAARSRLLGKAGPGPDDAVDPVALTGIADEPMRRATGRTIAEWLEILDAWDATKRTHTEIARWLVAEQGVPGWWSQSVTVGYERARGMRAMHQQGATFSVTASRTIRARAEQITDAFTDPGARSRWIADAPMRQRPTRGGSIRFDWDEPASRIAIYLVPKDAERTQVSVNHERLPDATAADEMKGMWRERLAALKEMLEAA
jgi:uncharacterized protein YndB with AHSA1/START domain